MDNSGMISEGVRKRGVPLAGGWRVLLAGGGRAVMAGTQILLASVLLAACGGRQVSPLGPEERVERDALVEDIRTADTQELVNAFNLLSTSEYTRYIRTEQYDEEDFLIAYTEHIAEVRLVNGERQVFVQQADSGGTFDYGFFRRFQSENVVTTDPVNLVPLVLPDEPVYLDARNMDRYAFRELSDTLLWDRQAQVVEARARPDLADGLNVRRARHYIDRGSNILVAMYIERVDLALLFREESSFYVDVTLLPDGQGAVPNNTRFESRIRTPFRGAYRVRTVSTYTDVRPIR